MRTIYNHPFLEYSDLSSNLIEKGMTGERAVIERRLEDVGYQRLSPYWKPFVDCHGKIRVDIDLVWNMYCFDRALRLCLFDAIERIEIAVRNKLVHIFTCKYGPNGYLDAANFPGVDMQEWSKWKEKITSSWARSNNDLVREFKSHYTNAALPFWIACELMDFGSSVKLFEFVEKKMKNQLAAYLNIRSTNVLLSWLRELNDVRNACAHHNRVWNKRWAKQPMLPKKQWEWYATFDSASNTWVPDAMCRVPSFQPANIGVVLTICHMLLKRTASTSRWRDRLFCLMGEPRFASIPLSWMGLPHEWKKHPLWQA